MALIIENSVTINMYDTTRILKKNVVAAILASDFKQWDWIEKVKSSEAQEYHYSHITLAMDEVQSYVEIIKNERSDSSSTQLNIKYYISSHGELGEFVLQTRHQHGDLVAFYILQIAPIDLDSAHRSINHSETIRKSSTYEYQLAHFLYFQHINAGDYINGNTNKQLKTLVSNFSDEAQLSLEDLKNTSEKARRILSDTSKKSAHEQTRSKRRALIALRRYRKVFLTVRNEANTAKIAAGNDLKNAYNTYHAQVDLTSSIVYWNEKVIQHNKSKWRWLGVVVFSVILTFASPVLYYTIGGASALVERSDIKASYPLAPPPSTDSSKSTEAASNPELNSKENSKSLTDNTLRKVAFASGIADLTGAALIVALMSVLLRLSLRQYNTYMFLGHDAEERVTMLKTYLALSNEGKLTADGDMKLVLEALFRPSQSSAIPDSTPATPIELVIKAITERK